MAPQTGQYQIVVKRNMDWYPQGTCSPSEHASQEELAYAWVSLGTVSSGPYYVPLTARATSMYSLGGTWNSGLQVQNLSTNASAHVSMRFYRAVGTGNPGQLAATYNASDPGGTGSWHLPSNAIPAVPSDFRGSVVIQSDQPLAVNANAEETTGSPVRKGVVRGSSALSTTLRFPQVVKAAWGWNSYVVIQNTTGSSVSATIRYYNTSDGSQVALAAQSQSIPAYSSWIVHQSQNTNLLSGWGGSAVVTSSQPLAGVAGMTEDMSEVAKSDFTHYSALSSGATTVYVPRLVRNYFGYNSGLAIQSAGTSVTNVTIQFMFAGNTYTHSVS